MTRRLNSCPLCGQQLEFFGISHHKAPGRREPVHVRWRECTACGMMHADNFGTRVLATRKAFTKDELDKLFPTTRERREKGPRGKAAARASA